MGEANVGKRWHVHRAWTSVNSALFEEIRKFWHTTYIGCLKWGILFSIITNYQSKITNTFISKIPGHPRDDSDNHRFPAWHLVKAPSQNLGISEPSFSVLGNIKHHWNVFNVKHICGIIFEINVLVVYLWFKKEFLMGHYCKGYVRTFWSLRERQNLLKVPSGWCRCFIIRFTSDSFSCNRSKLHHKISDSF